MARSVKVKVNVNSGHLLRDLEALGKLESGKVLRQAAMAGGKVVEGTMVEKAPVRTGDLADSISTVPAPDAERELALADVGPQVFYGRFVEYGTRQAPAHPFMRPAADSREKDAQKAATDVIRQAVGKAVR